jgi:ribosome maturation factor RimP
MDKELNKADPRLDAINVLLDGVLAGNELFRVATRIKGSAHQPMVDVFIDSEEGVTISECASTHRLLYAAIELEAIFPAEFKLDVSSPGLGHPLRLPRQFRRHVGRELEVVVRSSESDDAASVTGELVEAAEGGIVITSGNDRLEFRFDDIERAVIRPSFSSSKLKVSEQ